MRATSDRCRLRPRARRPASRAKGWCWLALFGGLAVSCAAAEGPPPAPAFAPAGVAFLQKHCLSCHSGARPKAGVTLAGFTDNAALIPQRKLWNSALSLIQSGLMPPEDRPQPAAEESAAFVKLVGAIFADADRNAKPDPGRVTMRRLNRVEYNRTVRDLLGVDFNPAEDFPADDIGHGFDNIGDVLTISPVLMERYLAAAESIAQRATLPAANAGQPPAEQMRAILARLASRAYRRPATAEEVARLVALAQSADPGGAGQDTGLRLALQAILVSPKFLFRVELDDRPDSPAVRPLDDYQLASRLSYFLWSTMPDDELFGLAEKRQLAANLEPQVRRMLADPKAETLVDQFAVQWLQLQRLESFTPDPVLFPTVTPRLRAAMLEETKLFFAAVLREDRSLLDLLAADFTFLNEPLARHYDIADTHGTRTGKQPVKPGGQPIRGKDFVRVSLSDDERGGLLTQASVLTVTSNPTRTSPVKRGRWVLEQLLGTPPPPPPPNVPQLPESPQAVATGSLRQRLEQHRADPTCANCHARMDPIGFALENYDAVGRFRTQDGEFPIDPSGQLPDGQTFQGPADLKRILREEKDLFTRCLAEKMLTYAVGRGLEYYDQPTLDRIVAAVARDNYRAKTLVVEIVKSDAFRLRRGLPAEK